MEEEQFTEIRSPIHGDGPDSFSIICFGLASLVDDVYWIVLNNRTFFGARVAILGDCKRLFLDKTSCE
ncbi:hypothetical protein JHK82_055977 [Glycine max]|uniref:Uncharacterized protein n=1 Tax=Glycine soja TaxID=3848 RepID=A0A0B2QP05_GLYSO|nr:hypothetical protein JHK86_055798 [Glycine max]KAG4909955.1 hypothetical protein JHK87_056071 [Glycine soja]KAG4918540.1 hypothetical protein JHK85_056821 [Glycine max]KAG5074613.1 hypothetical protein JHK84_055844 [Glycine max]KAG5077282.1 hypothetical protein JHK82_055977 [Glycine max]